MQPPVTAVYDANILYPAPLRDLFIRLAQAGLVRGRWTETIHDEWMQNVLANNPALSPERLARTRELMNEAVRDALVTVSFRSWWTPPPRRSVKRSDASGRRCGIRR